MKKPQIPNTLWIEIKHHLNSWDNKSSRTYEGKDKGKILAEIVKQHYALDKEKGKIDLSKIWEDLKVKVKYLNLNEFNGNQKESFRSVWGAWHADTIYVSDHLISSKAKRFTIAHEIGHIFFDYEKNQDVFYRTRGVGGGHEVIINDFAANLLIPNVDEKFYQEFTSKSLKDLSIKYDVPFDTISILIERYLNQKGKGLY